ncbi:peroxidase family protein [Actinomadura parmotrematis]|uniref:Heme peroxidase n=1 Tax=Actinomadura parmotrematis TaxID=2864039 RepID=A0ABS7FZQ1_9ACTN|nr:peroxidase family protein [Actinomadura parmotrematis]MBW8485430.1 heme peroxidase [Actinomadura parmotrematis]
MAADTTGATDVPGGPKARSIATDGARNRLLYLAMTRGERFWRGVERVPAARLRLNAALIDRMINEAPPRPEPLSMLAPYTSWASLTDRTYSGRHLPPHAPREGALPSVARAAELFARERDDDLCPRSTVLFAYFAQWFTDGFLRGESTEPRDPRRSTSNHHIDLNTLYGLTPAATAQLRSFEGGRLKSRLLDGAEFPPALCSGGEIKKEFSELGAVRFERLDRERRDALFALGSDRGNGQLGFTMMTVLFLREHNRVAALLADRYPRWDDERLFQTARNIVTLVVIKLVLEDYINHITPYHFRFLLDPRLTARLRRAAWNRENWASFEFNLVYRWHSLIPSTLTAGGADLPLARTLFACDLLPSVGLGQLFEEASEQRAGRIGLFNTDPLLQPVDAASIADARAVGLAPYNAYREHFGFPPVSGFAQISGDPKVAGALRERYASAGDVELYVGLFAEQPASPRAILPPLLTKIIAIDAFSQALTNPLLAPRVATAATFTPEGMAIIGGTRTLSQVLHRNVPEDPRPRFVSQTRRGAP